MKGSLSILVAVAVLVPGLAHAELQRWTDDNGVIYYRQVEPIPEPASTKSSTPAAKKTSSSRTKRSTTAKREKAAARKRRQLAEREEARQEKHCARLQAKLDRIEQQLDDGYREPKGNTLRRQRRDVQSDLFRDCS
jgi:hypothetical protein